MRACVHLAAARHSIIIYLFPPERRPTTGPLSVADEDGDLFNSANSAALINAAERFRDGDGHGGRDVRA